MDVAVSDPQATDLVKVVVTTREGSVYVLPDMDKHALKSILPRDNRMPSDMPALAMCNVSFAVLTLPFRIVDHVAVDGDILWKNPTSPA